MDWQWVIVGIVVAFCIAIFLRGLYRSVRQLWLQPEESAVSCGGCKGCQKSSAPPLIQISVKEDLSK